MSALELFAHPSWRHLVFALLHTLWQGAVLALLLVGALRWVSVRHAHARYVLALAAQFGVLLAGLATWAVLEYQPARPLPVRAAPPAAVNDAPVPIQARPAMTAGTTEKLTSPPFGWVPVAALSWLAGVVFMLAHTTGSALLSLRLSRGPRVHDRDLLDLIEGLCIDIGLRKRIRVVSCADHFGPAVLGVVWPTLVLPVAFATGLPADELKAILAHELAHIRRRDYLWNLVQMLVESLLFFNPAVWWLGRQVRVEREACCDATAVALTGRPLDYSRTLAGWAERIRAPMPNPAALAWAGPRQPSVLRERILRILRPAERPRVRISAGGLTALLLVGPAVLFGLHRGTLVAVELAAQILAPAERLERLKVAQAEYAPESQAPSEEEGRGKVTIKGTIRTPDGLPLRKPILAYSIIQSRNSTAMSAEGALKETFSVETDQAGSTYLYLEPEDFAPTFVGPFQTKRGQTVEGITILLDEGFPAQVRVVDEQGTPVAGVRINGALNIDGSTCSSGAGWLTNAEGVAVIPHASRHPYRFNLDKPGFQPFSAEKATLKTNGSTILTITSARPTRGIILTSGGDPIAGARIKPFFEASQAQVWERGGIDPPIATTDSAGRFTLDRLEEGKTYAFLIDTDAHGRGIATGVEAGQSDLRWSVGPERTITGTITGDLSALDRDGGKPVVRVNQWVAIPNPQGRPHSARLFWSVPVERTSEGGTFRITGLLLGETKLTAGRQSLPLVVEKPETTVAIDLSRPVIPAEVRRVVLRILTPDGAVRPSGMVQVNTVQVDASRRQIGPPGRSRSVPIVDGKVEFEAPAPGHVRYEAVGTIGYWFRTGDFEIEPGTEPKVVEIRSVPAGAIVGQVYDPDGKPLVGRVRVNFKVIEKPPGLQEVSLVAQSEETDSHARFFISPIPIGGTYTVVASKGHNKQVSKPIKLDGSKAAERVEIRLAKPVAASGRVVGPDGRPIQGMPVTLNLKHPQAGTSWGPPTPTDREGRFQFDDLNSEIESYWAVLDHRKDYQPAEATLNPGGKPIEIRLSPGHVVEGRVVDEATGWPIPGVEMYAHPPDWQPGERYAYEAEGLTDEQGRFRFSNLPDRPVNLNDRNGLSWKSPSDSRTVEPDQGGTFEIRASLPSWSKLKPVEPAGK